MVRNKRAGKHRELMGSVQHGHQPPAYPSPQSLWLPGCRNKAETHLKPIRATASPNRAVHVTAPACTLPMCLKQRLPPQKYKEGKKKGREENCSLLCLHTCQGLTLPAVSHLYELTVFQLKARQGTARQETEGRTLLQQQAPGWGRMHQATC